MTRNGILCRLAALSAISFAVAGVAARAADDLTMCGAATMCSAIPTTYFEGNDPPSYPTPVPEEVKGPESDKKKLSNVTCDCDSGCSSCSSCDCDCGCCCRPQPILVGGVDAVFLGPVLHRGFATTTVDGVTSNANGLHDFTYSPRVWVGYQGECWGLYGRFFYLSGSSQSFDPVRGGNDTVGSTLVDSLNLYTLDLEVVRAFGTTCRPIWWSFGARHAAIQAEGSASGSAFDVASTIATATSAREFNGAGFTTGLWGKLPVCCGSKFSWFWSLRGSVLWGNTSASVLTSATTITPLGAGASSIDMASDTSTESLFIGEAQLGLQWDHQLQCCPATAYARVMFEYQGWYANNATAESQSSAAIAGISSASAHAFASDLDLNLFGFSVGTGFMW